RFYACQIILALDYLHTRGIIYRDLKVRSFLVPMDPLDLYCGSWNFETLVLNFLTDCLYALMFSSRTYCSTTRATLRLPILVCAKRTLPLAPLPKLSVAHQNIWRPRFSKTPTMAERYVWNSINGGSFSKMSII